MVREQVGLGAHFVKMWVNETPEPGHKITPEIRAAIVTRRSRTARFRWPTLTKRRMAGSWSRPVCGISCTAPCGRSARGRRSHDRPEVSQQFIQMCLDNDVAFSPTLSISQNNWHFAEHPELLEDPELRAAFNPQSLARWEDPDVRASVVDDPGFEDRKAAFRQVQAFVKTIHDAGVMVALGTDSGTGNVPMGWGHPPRAGALRRGR